MNFEAQTDKFSLVNARACAEASGYVYANPCRIVTDLAHASILEGPQKETVIAFRGSVDIRDWLTDFEFRRTACPFGETHHGFFDAILSIQGQIITALQSPLSVVSGQLSRPPLFLTGHSLGGALAMLMAPPFW